MIKCFYDSMPLVGEVIAKQPTILGIRYHIRVRWNNGTYSDFSRMWWRTWNV